MTRPDDREPGLEPRLDLSTSSEEVALDRQLDAVLQELRQSYRVPRSAPPLDAMWSAIEETLPAGAQAEVVPLRAVAGAARGRRLGRVAPWIGMAATLLVGIGIGRVTARSVTERPVTSSPGSPLASNERPVTPAPGTPERSDPAVVAPPRRLASDGAARRPAAQQVVATAAGVVHADTDAGADEPYGAEAPTSTNRYLGQTTALIVSLANDAPRPGEDARFAQRARELLVTTRLMMDAPSTDEKSRSLLEDLELVLTQIVRMQGEQGKQELRLIREALEQRDLLPRLYSAVAESTDD